MFLNFRYILHSHLFQNGGHLNILKLCSLLSLFLLLNIKFTNLANLNISQKYLIGIQIIHSIFYLFVEETSNTYIVKSVPQNISTGVFLKNS